MIPFFVYRVCAYRIYQMEIGSLNVHVLAIFDTSGNHLQGNVTRDSIENKNFVL